MVEALQQVDLLADSIDDAKIADVFIRGFLLKPDSTE